VSTQALATAKHVVSTQNRSTGIAKATPEAEVFKIILQIA
jgi:hypothetical protein